MSNKFVDLKIRLKYIIFMKKTIQSNLKIHVTILKLPFHKYVLCDIIITHLYPYSKLGIF